MDQLIGNIIPIIAIGIIGYVFYSMFTKSGKGKMLGGTIVETTSEEIEQKSGMLTTTVRAHVVEASAGNKHVGLEISEGAKLGASYKPVKLSRSEAETLVRMLNEAISKT